MKLRYVIGAGVFVLGSALVGVRIAGESAFSVTPEVVPESVVSLETSLSTAVESWLAVNAPESESLYYPLGDAHTALLSRFKLAEFAQDTINVQYYLFHDDDAGRGLLANLVDAADRGVKVRLLLDDMDTKGREGVLTRLAAEYDQFEIRVFNPNWVRSARVIDYLARFPRSSRRMHNKSFSVDSIASIVGGRNVGNEYFDVNAEVAFSDFDILAAGKIATEVVGEFDEYWYSGIAVDVSRLGDPATDDDYLAWREDLRTAQTVFRNIVEKREDIASTQLASGELKAYAGPGHVIFDNPDKVLSSLFDRSGNLVPRIIELLSSAEQELLISSPYFIPGDAGMAVFRELRERGVEVTMLTNSFAANDVVAVHAGYIDYRKQLAEIGVKLYEFKPARADNKMSMLGSHQASLHAKTFVIDKSRQFVGSFNLDPRSAIHNTEMGVVFDSAEFGAAMHQSFLEKLKGAAYQVELQDDGKLTWIETLANGEQVVHEQEPETTLVQRTLVYLLSWLPVEWLM